MPDTSNSDRPLPQWHTFADKGRTVTVVGRVGRPDQANFPREVLAQFHWGRRSIGWVWQEDFQDRPWLNVCLDDLGQYSLYPPRTIRDLP